LKSTEAQSASNKKLSVHDSKHYSSALAALLAGMAGLLAMPKIEGGLSTCGCSAGVTVTAKLQTAEQLTEASECVGQQGA